MVDLLLVETIGYTTLFGGERFGAMGFTYTLQEWEPGSYEYLWIEFPHFMIRFCMVALPNQKESKLNYQKLRFYQQKAGIAPMDNQ